MSSKTSGCVGTDGSMSRGSPSYLQRTLEMSNESLALSDGKTWWQLWIKGITTRTSENTELWEEVA